MHFFSILRYFALQRYKKWANCQILSVTIVTKDSAFFHTNNQKDKINKNSRYYYLPRKKILPRQGKIVTINSNNINI